METESRSTIGSFFSGRVVLQTSRNSATRSPCPRALIERDVSHGSAFGFVGVLVATPLLAVVLVLVKMISIEEVPGEGPELPRALLKA